ncbi:hypothetical protein ACFL0D_04430 [Thermoproteota archaeon]
MIRRKDLYHYSELPVKIGEKIVLQADRDWDPKSGDFLAIYDESVYLVWNFG